MAVDRPNIIFILSDDQGPWAMGCAGNSEIHTPHLDALAASGLRADSFFCSSPVCSPARASLLTGMIPSQHGVHDWLAAGNTTSGHEPARNGELIEYLRGTPGYTDLFAAAGYECGISGKWHLGDSHHPQKGFGFWKVHAKGGGPYYDAPMVAAGLDVARQPGYVTDVITDNAIAWLEDTKESANPFYLSVHYTAPHSPWSRENHPEDLYDEYFNHCAFASVPDGLIAPDWVKYKSIPVNDPKARRENLSGYFAAVTAMDRNIGRLVAWLRTNSLLEETIVIFTSDNGMNMGHHGVYGKGNATFPMNMFEESVKVPFIVSHSGSITPGSLSSRLLSQYDFMPTLLEYAEIENPYDEALPGSSFASVLQNASTDTTDQVVVFDEYGPVRMVRTDRWKYVHRYAYGPNELYNIEEDPLETHNLAGSQAWRNVEKEMRERLFEWFKCYVDPRRDGAAEIVTGSGQLGLCGEFSDGADAFSTARVEEFL